MRYFWKVVGSFFVNNWQYIVVTFTILVIIGILVIIYLKLREKMIQQLLYTRSFSDIGAYEGERLVLTEMLYNPTFVPLFAINIEGYIFNGIQMQEYELDPKQAMQYYVSRFNIMPFQQIKRHHTILCRKRGFYQLEMVDIYYNKKVRYIDAPAQVYVYPKIIPLYETAVPTSTRQGDSFSRRCLIRDPFSFSGIKQYTFGDPFNSINFKATARSGLADLRAIRVNTRDFCSSRTFMVYLNFQVDTEDTLPTVAYEKMMELGLSFASAVIRDAAYNGHQAGFAANPVTVDGNDNIRFPIQSGALHLEEILKEMAKARINAGISFFSMLENDVKGGMTDAEVYIITPFISDELGEQIAKMEAFNNCVFVIKLNDEEKARREEEERQQNLEAAREAQEAKKRAEAKERAAYEKKNRHKRHALSYDEYKEALERAKNPHAYEAMAASRQAAGGTRRKASKARRDIGGFTSSSSTKLSSSSKRSGISAKDSFAARNKTRGGK